MSGILRLVKYLYSPGVLPYTNTVAGAVFFSFGDGIVQKVVEKRRFTFGGDGQVGGDEWQWKRIGTSALAGSVLGYLGSFWYPLLERMAPGKSPRAILKKLAIESALGLVLGAGVFLLVGAIQGKVWEDNVKAVKVNVPYLMATEVFLYLPAQWINFKYVPIAFRMLYVEVVQLVYDCIFIYLLYKEKIDERLEENKKQENKVKVEE